MSSVASAATPLKRNRDEDTAEADAETEVVESTKAEGEALRAARPMLRGWRRQHGLDVP